MHGHGSDVGPFERLGPCQSFVRRLPYGVAGGECEESLIAICRQQQARDRIMEIELMEGAHMRICKVD